MINVSSEFDATKTGMSLGILTGSSSATQAQCEDSHGHHTAAFSTVDVGVIGEDVGDRLRGVRLESHCEVMSED